MLYVACYMLYDLILALQIQHFKFLLFDIWENENYAWDTKQTMCRGGGFMDIGSVFIGLAIGLPCGALISRFLFRRKGKECWQCKVCGELISLVSKPAICPHCRSPRRIIRVTAICIPVPEEGKRKKF